MEPKFNDPVYRTVMLW